MTTEDMTTIDAGNTKPASSKIVFRGRAFQFTLNEPEKYESLKNDLTALKTCDYLLSCEELAPTTGHKHIHIYTHFSQPYRLSKKILNYKTHIEVCRGSPKQNIAYIEKDGNILDEIGERPSQGIKTVKELEEADIKDIDPHLYNIKHKIDDKKNEEEQFFNMLEEIEKDDLKGPEIIYICGDSGKGKTYKAYKIALSKFDKKDIGKLTIENNFIQITNERAKCYIIEEFRPSQIKAASFLQLTDKYGYTCNIKGSFKSIRPQCIIIASIIKPEDLYKNEEINKQFTRRITQTINLGYEPTDNDLLDDDL
nr:replication-associated protein [Cressdnaviricota sp.]